MARTLELGGKTRELRFGLDELLDAEDVIERPIRPLIWLNRGLTGNQIIALLWATCRREDKDLNRLTVRGWVREYLAAGGSLLEIENPIVAEIVESGIAMPKPEDRPRPPAGANGSATS